MKFSSGKKNVKTSEMEKKEEEEDRGGGVMVSVYDLQGEPKMFRSSGGVSDPGVAGSEPRGAHDLTGHGITSVSALTPPWSRKEIHQKNPPQIVFRTTDRGRERHRRGRDGARPGFGSGGSGGQERRGSRGG